MMNIFNENNSFTSVKKMTIVTGAKDRYSLPFFKDFLTYYNRYRLRGLDISFYFSRQNIFNKLKLEYVTVRNIKIFTLRNMFQIMPNRY